MHSEEQFESQHGLKGRNSLETDRQKGVLFVLGDSLLTSGRHKVIQMEFCDNTENINVFWTHDIYQSSRVCVNNGFLDGRHTSFFDWQWQAVIQHIGTCQLSELGFCLYYLFWTMNRSPLPNIVFFLKTPTLTSEASADEHWQAVIQLWNMWALRVSVFSFLFFFSIQIKYKSLVN